MNPENIDAKTRELIGALSFDSPTAEKAVTDWFHMFPESLYRIAGTGVTRKAEYFVRRLLALDPESCGHLCNGALMEAQAAVKLALSLHTLNPNLDIKLARAAVDWAEKEGGDQKPVRRCLEILAAMSSGSRINSTLMQLLKTRNGAVRSKVVHLLVRTTTNEASIRKWLRDPDPRMRANVLESLGEVGKGADWVRGILLENLNDPDGRAAANVAVGLYRMGAEEPAVARLSEMALSKDPTVRCSAAWAMGQVRDLKLFDLVNQLRTDSVAIVRWHALKSLSNFNRAGVKPKLVECEPSQEQPEEVLATPEPPPPPPPPAREPEGPVFTTRTFGRLM